MNYQKMNLEDIIAWCKANNQVAWLKAENNKMFPVKDEDGNVIGEREISFIELKVDFCKMFMPEIMPKAKPKKPTMKDRINAL